MTLLRVALPVAVAHGFDYLPPPDWRGTAPAPGTRVVVPFGRRRVVGVVMQQVETSALDASSPHYKHIDAVIDNPPLLPPVLLELCRWCAAYYHYPLGQVIATALPSQLRGEAPAQLRQTPRFSLTASGHAALPELPSRNVAQRGLLERLALAPATRAELDASARGALARAQDKGWVEEGVSTTDSPAVVTTGPTLTDAQATALTALETQTEGYAPLLLDGVTGSGKTELYLRMAEHAVKAGRQVLALAPEIGLTPQLVERFAARFGSRVACYHSGMGEAARAQTWLGARAGLVDIIVGTRSAIFVPMARPGLIIVDEEHDSSYKQQDGLRYSARDLAVLRAHRHGIPVILGSATPSLESLHNVSCERYRHVRLSQRVNARPPPRIGLLDIRNLPLESGLSAPLLAATRRHLDAGGQALFFINRRGFSPVLVCHQCGWTAPCPDCDARLTFHRRAGRLVCHHCGHMEALPSACPSCGHAPLAPVGQGTERIEDALRRQFPGERVERIDSDRTRSASALEKLFAEVRSGAIRILVGTQILAKGHDFPGLTLAGLIDVDGALYGTDFRALEHMTQLVTQVAGRVGRGSQAGEVILQTHVPEHPQLQKLVRASYAATAQALLAERRDAGLPPFASLALVRAEAPENSTALKFLHQAREALGAGAGVDLLGPVPAVMERRAGRYRAQLLIRSDSRAGLQGCLARGMPRLRQLKTPGKLRWSLDVDPADLF